MASIIINGPSSHTFDATTTDVITASAVVANNGDRTGYARMLIEGSPSGAGDLTPIPPGPPVTVTATANLAEHHAGQSRTLTARLYEMTAENKAIGVLGEHSQAVAQIAALEVKKKAEKKPDVKVWNPFTGEWKMIPADQLEAHLVAGWVTEEPTLKTKEVVGKPEMIAMYNRIGALVMVRADLQDTYLGLGYTMEPVEVTETIVNGIPVVAPPPLIDAFDSVNLTELEELDEGGFFTEGVQVLRDTVVLTELEQISEGGFFTEGPPPPPAPTFDTVSLTELEEISEGGFFVDAPPPEEITYSWDDIYITPAPPPPEEITYSWDDIYITPVTPTTTFRTYDYDVVDTSTMEGRITAFEQASPYYGVTRADVLAGIFGEEEEVFEPAPFYQEEVFEPAPFYQPEVFEPAPFYVEPVPVDTFQDTHDYFANIGAFDPVFETVVIYEEDDGYVWLDPTPTTYEVDYWYGEG